MEPKITLLLFEPNRQCWSMMRQKYFVSDDIKDQIWAHDGIPFKTIKCTLKEALEIIRKNPGDSKSHRNATWIIESDCVPLKAFVGLDHWSGRIFVDLDLIKSPRLNKMDANGHKLFYKALYNALKELCPKNFEYIEHSSSGIGIHCYFRFDCEKNEENFKSYARFVYDIFRNKLDDYIKDFSHIFTDPECLKSNGKSEVFDDIYERPYQKNFITGIDSMFNEDCDGDCEGLVIPEEDVKYVNEDAKDVKGSIKISDYTYKKKWSVDHNDRFYILTALKKYCDKDTAYKLWWKFCQNISLYKQYKTKDFINQFFVEWDKIDAKTGHLSILKKYGFNVDDKNIYYNLNENEWLGDIVEDIVSYCENGLNMVEANTGVGKTNSWISLNDKYLTPLERPYHKPILIIEPLNSIVETKYDEAKFRIVIGSKKFGAINDYEMVISNYNHLVKYDIDGKIGTINDLDKFLSKFELVIIDESHIMLKDVFRADVLIPFLQSLSKVQSTKVILQTATTMFEKSILDIKRTFHVNKPDKINKKIIYRKVDKKFSIEDIICLVDYYINNKKKVYIYWSNGSLQNMNKLKFIYHDSDQIVIYHKRNHGDDDMTHVSKEHNIDGKNIIMSSCYFGVGNDLNDILEDTAVIIVGNNTWQEDIQAIGRWRNVKNIEVCILLKDDVDEAVISFGELMNKNEWLFKQLWEDKLNRDKSIVIGGKTFQIKDESYIKYLAAMKSAIEYNSQWKVKNDEFERRGFDVRKTIKNLVSEVDYTEYTKLWKKQVKAIRDELIYEMVNNDEYNYNEINKDQKISRCAKIIKKLKANNLIKYCKVDCANSILKYEKYIKYYKASWNGKSDYGELFSILWVREQLNALDDEQKNETIEMQNGCKVSTENYIIIQGYLIWMSYKNEEDNEKTSSYNYFKEFRNTCNDFCFISDNLVMKLFAINYTNDDFNKEKEEFYSNFFNLEWIEKNKKNINEENIVDTIKQLWIDEGVYSKIFYTLVEYCNEDNEAKAKFSGKIGGKISSPKKKIKDLDTGIIYESCSDCAKAIGKSNAYVSKYKNRFVKIE